MSHTEIKEKTVPQNIIVQNVAQCAPRDQNNFVAPVLTDTGAVSMKETCFAESTDADDSCFRFVTDTSCVSVNIGEYNFRALVAFDL